MIFLPLSAPVGILSGRGLADRAVYLYLGVSLMSH